MYIYATNSIFIKPNTSSYRCLQFLSIIPWIILASPSYIQEPATPTAREPSIIHILNCSIQEHTCRGIRIANRYFMGSLYQLEYSAYVQVHWPELTDYTHFWSYWGLYLPPPLPQLASFLKEEESRKSSAGKLWHFGVSPYKLEYWSRNEEPTTLITVLILYVKKKNPLEQEMRQADSGRKLFVVVVYFSKRNWEHRVQNIDFA